MYVVPFAVISPASWREGQKLVKMVLGPAPKLPSEEHSSHPAGRQTRTGGAQEHELLTRYTYQHIMFCHEMLFEVVTGKHQTVYVVSTIQNFFHDPIPVGLSNNVCVNCTKR